jgi:hypothetical protein
VSELPKRGEQRGEETKKRREKERREEETKREGDETVRWVISSNTGGDFLRAGLGSFSN